MAKVMISSPLRDSILNKVTSKYNNMMLEKRETFLNNNADRFYRCIVPEELEARARQLPPKLVHSGKTMYFSYRRYRYEISFPTERPLPEPYLSHHSPPVFTFEGVDGLALRDEMLAVEKEIDELKQKTDALAKELTEVLTTCKTLKQVMDAWPSVLNFCPDDVKARHAAPEKPRLKKGDVKISDSTKLELVKVRMI